MFVIDASNANEFGKQLGFKNNDEILSLNGAEVTPENFRQITEDFKNNTKVGDKVEVIVERKVKGNTKTQKLKAKAILVEQKKPILLEFNPNASPDQLQLRNYWLGAK